MPADRHVVVGLAPLGTPAGPLGHTKSTNPARIAENLDVFDFQLTAEELSVVDKLETGKRGGPEPEDVTLANFGQPIPEG